MVIVYYFLLLVVIVYHFKLLFVIVYYFLLLVVIVYYFLLLVVIVCYFILLVVIVYYFIWLVVIVYYFLLLVIIVYYFKIWNKKEYDKIINRVINRHLGTIVCKTQYKHAGFDSVGLIRLATHSFWEYQTFIEQILINLEFGKNVWNILCIFLLIKTETLKLKYKLIVNMVTLVEGDPSAPFSIAIAPRCREGHYST